MCLMCEFDFLKNKMYISINIQDICIAQHILCKCDDHYWIGMASKVDPELKEAKVKFMHPSYSSNSYKWPTRDDIYWVPQTHLLVTLETSFTSSISVRQYHVSKLYIYLIN